MAGLGVGRSQWEAGFIKDKHYSVNPMTSIVLQPLRGDDIDYELGMYALMFSDPVAKAKVESSGALDEIIAQLNKQYAPCIFSVIDINPERETVIDNAGEVSSEESLTAVERPVSEIEDSVFEDSGVGGATEYTQEFDDFLGDI